MSVINLGRTSKTNITFYQTDGMGRDGYITYNNAGFWKDKYIKSKKAYPHKKFAVFRSLFHRTAPFKYQSDGSGRDSYVIENHGGLVKTFEPLAKQKLANFLRTGDEKLIFKNKIFLTKRERKYMDKLYRIQNGVISRLYNDSLERMKRSYLQCRTSSLNDFFTKEKYKPMTRAFTPQNNNTISIDYIHSDQNLSGGNLRENKEKIRNLKINSHRRKDILDKYYNKTNKENKKVKILKNLRINPSGLKCNFITDEKNNNHENISEYNIMNSFTPKNITSKSPMFGYGNNIKKKNLNNFNNNTFGSFSATNMNKTAGNGKLIYNIKKRNNIKKYILEKGKNVFSEPNKTNN